MASQMEIITNEEGPVIFFSTNATTSSEAIPAQTTTEPGGSGVVGARGNGIMLWPFGTNAANENADLTVVGWWKTPSGMWFAAKLIGFRCTLGTDVGLSGSVPADTDYWADTIDEVDGTASYEVMSAANQGSANTPAWIYLDGKGCNKYELVGDKDTQASFNAVAKFI